MAMLLAETSNECFVYVAVRYVHCVAIGKGRAVARILNSTVLHTSLFRHIWVAQSLKMEDVQRRFGKELQLRKKLSIKEENYSEESSQKDSRKEW